MTSSLADWLNEGPLLADGAWGTELQRRGLALGECPDAWNLSRPEQVEAVARAYVEAGSRVILTNTFRSNRIAYGAPVVELNRAGVRLSKRAAGDRARVFASIGPSGKLLVAGDVTADDLRLAFAEQAAALASAGADALLIETMSDLEEARIALEAAKATGLPVVVSFAFDTGRNKDRTMMGVTPEQAARAMEEAGADAVGANCGAGIEHFARLCRRLKQAAALPVWVKPNAGLPEVVGGEIVYSATPGQFASLVPELVEMGASFLGGCCGTNPEFIRAAARVLSPCG